MRSDTDEHAQPQSRAQARAREQSALEQSVVAPPVRAQAGLTRPPAAGELSYDSTITAPTEWVPYVYTTAEIQIHAAKRGIGVAAVICGAVSVLSGIFLVWGAPLALAAVVLALVSRAVESRKSGLWLSGLGLGLVGLGLATVWILVITRTLPEFYAGV
jgi:hypothetical protein